MQNLILIFFIITNQVNGFIFPNFFQNTIKFPINNPLIENDEIKQLPLKNDIFHKLTDFNQDLITHNFQNFKTQVGPEIVKFSSGLLPAMDSIAHHVLKANQNFITAVLNYDQLPDHIKKELVLFSISAAQHGDQMGGQILEFYYHLTDKLL